jgi:hypothetical protein
MTNDTLLAQLGLADLGADWRRQTMDIDRVRRLAGRRRRQVRISMLGKLVGAAAALAFGVYYVWRTLSGGPIVYGLSAILLFIACPLILLEYAGARRRLAIDHGDTPQGVLRRARQEAALQRRLLWSCRAAALLLGAGVLGMAGLAAAGLVPRGQALSTIPVWAVTAFGIWLWQARKGERLAAEAGRCDALLAELGEADRDDKEAGRI